MTEASWTYETLLTNGWYGFWIDGPPGPCTFGFTYYRSEISIHTVHGHGDTGAEATADAVRQANDWLQAHPGYRPRRPWITPRGLADETA